MDCCEEHTGGQLDTYCCGEQQAGDMVGSILVWRLRKLAKPGFHGYSFSPDPWTHNLSPGKRIVGQQYRKEALRTTVCGTQTRAQC